MRCKANLEGKQDGDGGMAGAQSAAASPVQRVVRWECGNRWVRGAATGGTYELLAGW